VRSTINHPPSALKSARVDVSAIVLAGGRSSRMGRDKARIEFEGRPLIALAIEKVREAGVVEVFVSCREGESYDIPGCPVLHDLEPGFGPLGGIERGLHECRSPLLLVLAVDMPHMTVAFLRKMAARCDRLTGAVPRLENELEPLAAVYPKRCHAIAFDAIARSRHAVRDFAEACIREQALRPFTVSERDRGCFANWNAPEDVAKGHIPGARSKKICPAD